MKKLIIAAAALGMCLGAQAYTVRNHAAVAYIAQQHLTPQAKEKIDEILHGETLMAYASWPDFYVKSMLHKNGKPIAHSVKVDQDFNPVNTNGSRSAYNAIKESARRLENYKDMPDSARIADLSLIIHLIADIHCPSHISYADGRSRAIKYVFYRKKGTGTPKKVNYHIFWDDWGLDQIVSGGYMDLAMIADICSESEILDIQKGSLEDWVHDSAVSCKDAYDITDEADIDLVYVAGKYPLAVSQIRKAGYRLAAFLNGLFK